MVIKGNLATDKMLAKSMKDHPIVAGSFAQWLVRNFGIKEAMYAKVIAYKLKYKVDDIPPSATCSDKTMNELNTSAAYENKASDTAIRKLGSLAKK